MSEHDEQVILFQWAALQTNICPALDLMFAVPNGAKLPWRKNEQGRRYSPEAKRLKDEGLKAGVPDVWLPVPNHGFHGLVIELKDGDGKLRPEQVDWLDALNQYGYKATCCRGADDAIQTIMEYLGIK